MQSFPGGSVVKNSVLNAGDTSSVPSPGRFHGPRGNKAHRPLTVGLLKWAGEAALSIIDRGVPEAANRFNGIRP